MATSAATAEAEVDAEQSASGAPASSVSAEAVRRVGSGRAESAIHGGGVMVVATTSGVYARTDSSDFFELATSLGSDELELRQSADGGMVLLRDPNGQMEIWHVEPTAARLAASFGEVLEAELLSRDVALVATARSLDVVSTADGSELFRYPLATDQQVASLGVSQSGAVVALSGGEGPSVVRLASGEAVETMQIPVQDDARVLRLEAGVDDSVTVTWHPEGDEFSVAVTRFALGGGQPEWTQLLDIDVAWDLADDDSIVVAERTSLRVIGPDGTVAPAMELRDVVVRWVFAQRRSGALHATVIYQDGVIEVVDTEAGTLVTADETGRQIADAVPSGDRSVIAVDGFGVIRFVDEVGVIDVFDFEAGAVNDVALSSDGVLATAGRDGNVRVVREPTASAVDDGASLVLDHPQGNVDSVAFAPDGRLVTGVAQRRTAISFDDSITVWNLQTSMPIVEHGGDAEPVGDCSFFRNVVAFSPNGDVVVSLSHDFTVQLLDVDTGAVVHVFSPHGAGITDMAISDDGRRLATAAESGSVRIWDLDSYELEAEHDTMTGGFRSLAFLPSGDELIVSDLGGSMFRFDVLSGEVSAPFESGKPRDARIAVSPDGRLAASGGSQGRVQLWSTADGRVVGDFAGHDGAVIAVAFGADGDQLVTGSDDGTAILWELTVG